MNNQVNQISRNVQSSEVDSEIITGEMRTCHNYWCHYSTIEPLTKCPKCGRPMLVPGTFRKLGIALASLGAVLVLIATSTTILVASSMPSFNRRPAAIWFIGGVFFLLFLVGLVMMTAGISQGLTGRRNQRLMTVMIMSLVALAILATLGRALL